MFLSKNVLKNDHMGSVQWSVLSSVLSPAAVAIGAREEWKQDKHI